MSSQDRAREIAHRIYDDWRNLQIDPDTNETMTAYGMVMKIAGEVSESQRKELDQLHKLVATQQRVVAKQGRELEELRHSQLTGQYDNQVKENL